eukprot:10775743-Lingulodinium_polyedra.AAC.1
MRLRGASLLATRLLRTRGNWFATRLLGSGLFAARPFRDAVAWVRPVRDAPVWDRPVRGALAWDRPVRDTTVARRACLGQA